MSLITLTFRNGPLEEYQFGLKGHDFSDSPAQFDESFENAQNAHIKIIKAVKFFGTEELCVIGELTQGSISPHMCAFLGNKKAEVKEVESKFGRGTLSRKGTKLTMMLSGVNENDLSSVEEIEFITPEKKEKPKIPGKIIIC